MHRASTFALVCVCMDRVPMLVCQCVAVECLLAVFPVCSCNSVSYIPLYLVAVYAQIYWEPSVICYLCKYTRPAAPLFVLHSKPFVCVLPVSNQTSATAS